MLFVEIVQQLSEFGIVDDSFFLLNGTEEKWIHFRCKTEGIDRAYLAEISLHKWSIQMKWYFQVQFGLFDHLTEFTVGDRTIAVRIE